MNLSKQQRIVLTILLFVFIAFVAPHLGGFGYDTYCFQTWAKHIHKFGLRRAYTEWNNYMPVFQYILYIYSKIQGSEEGIINGIRQLKWVALAFDFAGLYYVYKWTEDKTDFIVLLLFNMLNLAYVYNTMIWGQVDGIFTTMVFASMFYAYNNRITISMLLFVLALNVKLQAVMFLPMVGLLYLFHMVRDRAFIKPAVGIVLSAILQMLLLWPFLRIPNGFQLFWKEVTAATQLYSFVNMNAYNLWCFVLPPDKVMTTPDATIIFAGISYMKLGLLLFCTASFFAMLPLLRSVWAVFMKREEAVLLPKEKLWLTCALVAILFFYFNTQMHERYCHPAFIFITAYAFYSRHFLAYILFSIGYALNLEVVNKFIWLKNYETFIFDTRTGAALFGICIVLLFVRLYQKPSKPLIA